MVAVVQAIQDQVFWVSMFAAAVACVLNARYAWRHRRIARGRNAALIAVMALGYVVSYVLHLSGVWGRLEWSQNMIIPSMFSWVVVWWAWPLLLSTEEGSGKDG